MNIPEAAIEAAAVALWGDFTAGDSHYPHFSDYPKRDQDYWRHDARVAIEAAMPAIREALAQEIEDTPVEDDIGSFYDGYSFVVRIVRGGTP